MTGYVRNDTLNNIADGNVIAAADLDGEFDALVNAFSKTTGHTHDDLTGDGAPITKVGPTQDVVFGASSALPKVDDTVSLGSSSFEFKDLYIDGVAYIDDLRADTVDIDAGTIDGVTITSPRIVTSVLDTNGNVLINITATSSAVNNITLANAATTGTPTISATGNDTNISLNLVTKGTGTVKANGTDVLVSGGALGTPSSGTLTNATGLPISTGVSGLGANVAAFLAVPSSANLASAVTNETGTGALVFANSPILTTPNLDTPSAAVLTNATGLPLTTGVIGTLPVANGGTGITSFGTGVATWLGTPSSANLAAAVTDETGTGSLVFSTSPTLVTPILGAATGTSLALTGGALTARAATTQDGVVVQGRAGGTSTYAVTITPTTLSANRTLTLANGDTTLQAGTVAVTGTGLGQFASTTSSQLAGVISDETGSGVLVFGTTPTITGLREKSVAIAASDIDLSLGNYFTRTISGATTLTVSNVATSGDVAAFILVLTNGGSATVTYFSGVTFAGGTAPTLTASGVDILGFFTINGGTTWRGLVLALDIKAP
jgi:hypothetical protein